MRAYLLGFAKHLGVMQPAMFVRLHNRTAEIYKFRIRIASYATGCPVTQPDKLRIGAEHI